MCRRTRKLYVFLREHRHEIVDRSMHDSLATAYRKTGAGKPPLPPGLLAMASLVQGYQRVSDAEAVQLAQVDAEEVAGAGLCIGALRIDRGYVSSPTVQSLALSGVDVVCRPWRVANGDLYSKEEFDIDLAAGTVCCPAGQVRPARPGQTVKFGAEQCDACSSRANCTTASVGSGRSLSIASDEALQQAWRSAARTKEGRDRLRERVPVEHVLAHVMARQGRRARYRGLRKVLYELRRTCSIVNRRQEPEIHARRAARAPAGRRPGWTP